MTLKAMWQGRSPRNNEQRDKDQAQNSGHAVFDGHIGQKAQKEAEKKWSERLEGGEAIKVPNNKGEQSAKHCVKIHFYNFRGSLNVSYQVILLLMRLGLCKSKKVAIYNR